MKKTRKKTLNNQQLQKLSLKEKVHLMNSITGIKPANMIATESKEGKCNLAIFSSVVHLGSQPALLGFVLRPCLDGNRHTYQNIKQTGIFTINAVPIENCDAAHYTSAPFDRDECEFEAAGLTSIRYPDFSGLFVKESPIQIGLKFKEEIPIHANNTRLMIGEVVFIACAIQGIEQDGQLNLEKLQTAGISGLNRYYDLKIRAEYAQAEVAQFPQNLLHDTPKNH